MECNQCNNDVPEIALWKLDGEKVCYYCYRASSDNTEGEKK